MKYRTANPEPQVYSSPGRYSDLGSQRWPYKQPNMISCHPSPVAHLWTGTCLHKHAQKHTYSEAFTLPTWKAPEQPEETSGSCCYGWSRCRLVMRFYQTPDQGKPHYHSSDAEYTEFFTPQKNFWLTVYHMSYLHADDGVDKEQHNDEQSHIWQSLKHTHRHHQHMWTHLCYITIMTQRTVRPGMI